MSGSAPPPSLRDVVCARSPELAGVHWQRLPGGRTNRVWRVGATICKLFATDGSSPMFPNDPNAEIRALQALSSTAIAPEMIAAGTCNDGDWVLYEAAEGEALTVATPGLFETLGQLHAIPQPSGFPVWPGGAGAILSLGKQMLQDVPDCAERARLLRLQPDGSPRLPPARAALIHRDAVAGNAIRTSEGVILIDWQCPASGDPAEDLATALSPAMQAVYGRGQIHPEPALAAYPHPDVKERYARLRPWFAWRMAAFCLWKVARGDNDYRRAFEAEVATLEQG